ncbi:sigma-54-dependent transcriptional regulator [Desulfovibrio inopinatus]|uniref:sigma-54-dependent transcriptional regulator n=1 Tax=Desulfovibrio inopinatus TaxID=102109 RepID=UPI0004167FBC|nr:sigma-54 dependent transcriptional regulator [Desulfovibrio inopinatus]
MSSARILIVEDEQIARENLELALSRKGYTVQSEATGADAIAVMERETFDIVVTDLCMPQMDGMEVLKRAKELQPRVEVLVVTGYGTVDSAVEAMNRGAYSYLSKPLQIKELLALVTKALEKCQLRQEIDALRGQLEGHQGPLIIGQSPAMQVLKQDIAKVAAVDSTVLITGETGTGKELIAKAIHALSARRDKRFLAVNCGAFNQDLLANELFGHEPGAYTGARNAPTKGLMEAAQGGTFLLDEIGDMELMMQVKLLRVLEERSLIRVGGTNEVPIDIRVLAATNKNLAVEVSQGTFRRDLFYRLNVITLHSPPLRERREDIGLLSTFFLDKYTRLLGKGEKRLGDDCMELLMHYEFPGNVRELENIVERAVVLCEGEVIGAQHLPPDIVVTDGHVQHQSAPREMISLKENEKRHIAWVLEQCGGNRTCAAQVLDIDRATIWRKLKAYGMDG